MNRYLRDCKIKHVLQKSYLFSFFLSNTILIMRKCCIHIGIIPEKPKMVLKVKTICLLNQKEFSGLQGVDWSVNPAKLIMA